MKSSWNHTVRVFAAVVGALALGVVAGCSTEPPPPSPGAPTTETVLTEPPEGRVTVLSSTDPAELALGASQTFFSSAPVVVVAAADDVDSQKTAAAASAAITGPVLLSGGGVSDDGIATELRRLGVLSAIEVSPDPALTSGDTTAEPALSALDGVEIIHLDTSALDPNSNQLTARDLRAMTDALPSVPAPQSRHEMLALVEGTPDQIAAAATAQAAGAWPVTVPGGDPRASAEIVRKIAEAKALAIVGIGSSFGSADDLEWKVNVAETGADLPGGGQLVFSGKRMVTTASAPREGKPSPSPSAGSTSVVADAQIAAASYAELFPEETIVPAIEIPVTTASTVAGPDGDYSQEIPVAEVRPLVEEASATGVYVVLRFEPGRATFAEQLAEYSELLALPSVGVALDVTTRQGTSPKQAKGTVSATELNEALTVLSTFVRDNALPQKLVVVQQGKPEAIVDRELLDPGAGELAVVLDVTASTSASAQPDQWTKNLTGAPVGTHGGWTTMYRDPAKDIEFVARLNPVPEYVAGAH